MESLVTGITDDHFLIVLLGLTLGANLAFIAVPIIQIALNEKDYQFGVKGRVAAEVVKTPSAASAKKHIFLQNAFFAKLEMASLLLSVHSLLVRLSLFVVFTIFLWIRFTRDFCTVGTDFFQSSKSSKPKALAHLRQQVVLLVLKGQSIFWKNWSSPSN